MTIVEIKDREDGTKTLAIDKNVSGFGMNRVFCHVTAAAAEKLKVGDSVAKQVKELKEETSTFMGDDGVERTSTWLVA
ncbi:MAG TPA: hypothetical protein DCY51_08305 [Bacteroidetes bacterium]|nr:hypothetical protein [Bacteroidota bacterium]